MAPVRTPSSVAFALVDAYCPAGSLSGLVMVAGSGAGFGGWSSRSKGVDFCFHHRLRVENSGRCVQCFDEEVEDRFVLQLAGSSGVVTPSLVD